MNGSMIIAVDKYSMDDDSILNIRYAVIRFRSSEESARLRILLRRHGYEEPAWLDSFGQHIDVQPFGQHVEAQPDLVDDSAPGSSGAGSLTVSSASNTPFLTLPTVLIDHSGVRPTQATSSIVLPLASVSSTSILSPSSSSRLSALASVGHSSTTETPPSTSQEASPPIATSPEPPPLIASPRRSEESSVFSSGLGAGAEAGSESGPGAAVGAEASGAGVIVQAGAVAATSGKGDLLLGARAWVSPAPLRPRGKKPKPHEDPNVYYTCELCKNRILGTRVSNLQNHVRRHSTLKQFQCCYCEYAHNEIAKVRLHMTNNHKDPESAPVNNLTADMQAVWRSLFRECFPTRAQRRRGMRQTSSVSQAGPGPSGVSSATTTSSGIASTSTAAASPSEISAQVPLSLRRRRHHRRLPRHPKMSRPRSDRMTPRGDNDTRRGDDDANHIPASHTTFSLCLFKNRKGLCPSPWILGRIRNRYRSIVKVR